MQRQFPWSPWWQRLNIKSKFRFAFSVLLFLMALIAAISILALMENRRRTEVVIVTSTEIQRLVLEMDNHLESARRLELDFFNKFPELGFIEAEETYLQPALDHVAKGIAVSEDLQNYLSQSTLGEAWRESQVNLYLYLSTANRHSVIVEEANYLLAELADEDSGLLIQFEDKAQDLEDIIRSSNNQELLKAFLEMRIFEKEYLVERKRPIMQSAINNATELAELINETSAFTQPQKSKAITHLDEYLTLAKDILQIDVEIRSKLNEFDLQTEVFDQVTNELVLLTNNEIQQAREGIYRSNTLAILLVVIISGLGVIVALITIRRLNQSITGNIISLTHSALEMQAGNLDHRVQIQSKDEFEILAESFNNMAGQISNLVGGLEREVEIRTQELLIEKNRAQHYLDVAGVLIITLDVHQNITLINKKGCKVLGGQEKDILGLNWFDNFILPEQVVEVKGVFNQIIDGGIRAVEYYENSIVRMDGEERLIAWHNSILKDDNDNIIGLLSSGEDITVRQQAVISQQEAYEQVISRQAAVLNLTEDLRIEIAERINAENTIKRQNQFLIALQTTTLELLSELDLSTLLKNIVTRAAQIMDTEAGYLELVDQLSGKLIPQVGIGALSESLEHISQPGEGIAGSVWKTGEPIIIENYDQWPDRVENFSSNSIRSIIGVPLLIGTDVIGVLGLAHPFDSDKSFDQETVDYMTQFAHLASIAIENARLFSAAKKELEGRQQTEREREQLVVELETKNRELESFVYTVSHDLKSPLVSISGFSSNLLKRYQEQLDDRGKHYLQRLQANVKHMEDLITVLLELSRIGRVVGELTPFPVESLLEDIVKTLSGEIGKSKAELTITHPLPTVWADRVRLGQVFSNLLDNSIKFRDKDRHLKIEIGCQEIELDFLFYVRDNGMGIDPRYSEKIFLPFQKLNQESEGLGIGMALASRIVEFHGGRIWFDSTPGEGTTFFFTLQNKNSERNKGQGYE